MSEFRIRSDTDLFRSLPLQKMDPDFYYIKKVCSGTDSIEMTGSYSLDILGLDSTFYKKKVRTRIRPGSCTACTVTILYYLYVCWSKLLLFYLLLYFILTFVNISLSRFFNSCTFFAILICIRSTFIKRILQVVFCFLHFLSVFLHVIHLCCSNLTNAFVHLVHVLLYKETQVRGDCQCCGSGSIFSQFWSRVLLLTV